MTKTTVTDEILKGLNEAQRRAVTSGRGPLLIVAGAGTGKTNALAHRVAWLIHEGARPDRILLLTFTRRAAAEMLRRVESILRPWGRRSQRPAAGLGVWGGTFHAMANRLLRIHSKSIGLDPNFTVLDRSDSEDVMNVCRAELGLARTDKRFPRKSTCMDIYSRCVNARADLPELLDSAFPWCRDYADELKQLFAAYVDRKHQQSVLDYDDLLLFWYHLMRDETASASVRNRFECVLVDEYQDTNALQAEILKGLCPDGRGLTVVGDDAQSIYSFRAATVRNILDFPRHFPGTTIVTLEQNYRSTTPILEATNAVIAQATQRYTKDLWSTRRGGQKPVLVVCEDENEQTEFVTRTILEHREGGIALRRQAVLFRTGYHSDMLEVELARRNIPFVKYGGLKFLEAAHVKDLLAFLRLAENPQDQTAGLRVLQMMPGFGPAKARAAMRALAEQGYRLQSWQSFKAPAAAGEIWPAFVEMMLRLAHVPPPELPTQLHLVREFYGPLLEQHYEHAAMRQRDLEQLEQLAATSRDRATFLADLTLDPPTSTADLAGPPLLDEDYLILSTIHSAKGCEWDAVYVIHAADGCIPSDMATGDSEDIEEERRLFYVALTRAKDWLYVCFPMRYYHRRNAMGDSHSYAQLTRFLPDETLRHFEKRNAGVGLPSADAIRTDLTPGAIRSRIRRMWE